MLSSLLRLASMFCAAVVLLSFGAFASDQAGGGSKQTVAKIGSGDSAPVAATRVEPPNLNQNAPTPSVERMREKDHSALREHLDDVNDVLTAPFKGVGGSRSIWAQRIVEGLLALLVFGLGIAYVARYAALRGV